MDDLMRLMLGAMTGDRAPLAEVLAVADRALRCLEDFPDAGVGWPPFQTRVAELYVKYRVRLEEVLKLLDSGLQAVEKQEKYRLSRELIPNELRDRAVNNKELTYRRTQQIRADYLVAVNRASEGKATFLNFWATWCGPCHAEHPQIQRLHELAKGRQNVQVLTIDVDASPTPVMAYMKEKGYTFPVIHAPALADRLFPWPGLPTNLLVNGKGWRTGMYPFRPGAEGVGRVLADLTDAAATR